MQNNIGSHLLLLTGFLELMVLLPAGVGGEIGAAILSKLVVRAVLDVAILVELQRLPPQTDHLVVDVAHQAGGQEDLGSALAENVPRKRV